MDEDKFLPYNIWSSFCDLSIDYPDEYYIQGFHIRPPLHRKRLGSLEELKNSDILFIKQDILCLDHNLADRIYSLSDIVISIVSGISSMTYEQPLKMMNSRAIRRWYTTNPRILHPKIIPLPIGFEEEDRLHHSFSNFYTFSSHPSSKIHLCVFTHHNTDYHVSRKSIPDLSRLNITSMLDKKSYPEYQDSLFSAYSSVCLRGAGYDTHRVYESIAAHSIPLIDNLSVAYVLSFHGLPFFLLEDLLHFDRPAERVLHLWHQTDWKLATDKLKIKYYKKLLLDS